MATVSLNTKAVGTVVKVKESGTAVEYIVIHKGRPSTLYDASCDGIWLMRKEPFYHCRWYNGSTSVENYPNSFVHSYLTNTFISRFDANTKAAIKQVKVPYTLSGAGDVNSGAKGVSAKVFSLGTRETGFTGSNILNDGAALSYFNTGNEGTNASRRIARMGGTTVEWWTRSHSVNGYPYIVTHEGDLWKTDTTVNYYTRPTFIFPTTVLVDDNGNIVVNTAPTISGSNQNLGNKNANFNINYSVNDADSSDTLTITEKRDNTTIRTINNATRNLTYTIPITITGVTLGAHTVTITVSDGKGGTATRTYTFTRVNAAPTISGSDQNLGDKNAGFAITYQVNDSDGDALTVTEQLNSTILRTLSNPQKGSNITLTLTDEQIRALTVNTSNTIKITANDGNGGVAYRTHTFTRTNTAPTISGEDEDVGTISDPFSRTYIISDAEGDEVEVRELLGDTVLRTYTATAGEENTIEVPIETWQQHPPGASALKVEATDSQGATSVRLYQFVKAVNQFCFCRKIPFATDAAVKRAILTPTWNIIGSTEKVEVCNNAFDEVPTWEDMTTQVRLQRPFNLSNETKTAEQWGLNYRVTATKNEGYIGEISCTGIGGAFD